MSLSAEGAGAILGHEAIYLEAYQDPVGIWTIAGGHTAAAGGLVPRAGMIITLAKAMEIFRADMAKFERGVSAAVRTKAQHEFDGFVSFHFNTGAVKTGSVDDQWNAGNRAGAMKTLNAYVNARGQRLAGLVTRRKEEEAMIMRGVYPKRKILVKDRVGSQGRYVTVDQLPGSHAAPLAVEVDVPMIAPPAAKPAPRQPNFLADIGRYIGGLLGWI